MAQDFDPHKLSSPRIFLLRMVVFLVLCGLIVFILHRQIWVAFLANPGLNALIIGVLLTGIALSFRQVIRLYPEVTWVNDFRLADPGLAVERSPRLLAPMAAILGDRVGRMAMSSQLMRGILDSIATRLDEARDLSRYMTGLLVFLGLLGTFWGLIETVGSVGAYDGKITLPQLLQTPFWPSVSLRPAILFESRPMPVATTSISRFSMELASSSWMNSLMACTSCMTRELILPGLLRW